jgi:Flp pilus assembly protein TadD
VVARNSLGNVLAKQNQVEAAIVAYREAVRVQPNNATAHYNWGMGLYNLGRIQDASARLRRARDLYRQQGDLQRAEQIDQFIQEIQRK